MEDKIKITGEDNVIEVDDKNNIEIKGDENKIQVKSDSSVEISGKDNKIKIKEGFTKTKDISLKAFDFFKQKKVINIIIVLAFLFLLIGGVWIRTQNLNLLKDETTGKYIPLALDPYYFLRVAETMVENNGLPEFDVMRYPSLKVGFIEEILPQTIIFIHKITSVFNSNISLQFIDIIYPPVFFAIGLIILFFLIYSLTKSKISAFLTCLFLSVIPPYLYRTTAGFADHEAIGMVGFFLVLLIYSISLRYLNKEHKKFVYIGILGLLLALVTSFTLASWGGIVKFIFMIVPLSFLGYWVLEFRNKKDIKEIKEKILFYSTWIIFSILFAKLFGFSYSSVLNKFILSSTGIGTLFVLGFILVDGFLIKKEHLLKNKKKFRILFSLLFVVLLGVVGLFLIGKNPFSLINDLLGRFIHPFGTERVSLTVAESAQPYLKDLIGQITKPFFYLFYLGTILLGINISLKSISEKKNKILFSIGWIFLITAILFTRYSSSSLFNGTNFISQLIYLGSYILFTIICYFLYMRNKIKIPNQLILISTWAVVMIIAGRGALRFFFLIMPSICFMSSYLITSLINYSKKIKDDLFKIILIVITIFILCIGLFAFYGFYNVSKNQAKYTSPSANSQWQNAMSWVRDNTPENAIFVHWWDYGYWVQYLGERATITDGGHKNTYWDHLIGRYVLTTPFPETAFSFMKTQNVSYLLIDQTDLGKYSAYSKIGSDKTGEDRFSMIISFKYDEKQTIETADSIKLIYPAGINIDEDIKYNGGDKEIFLPKEKTAIMGFIIEIDPAKNAIKNAEAVFYYNQQIRIPIKKAYYNNFLFEQEKGIDAIIRVIPYFDGKSKITNTGAVIYLSPKVSKSLVSELYLLNNIHGNYEGVKLVHTEDDPLVKSLKQAGVFNEDFVYYNGFRGPIKIWKVDYPSNILEKEEFLSKSGEYAEFDDLQFTK